MKNHLIVLFCCLSLVSLVSCSLPSAISQPGALTPVINAQELPHLSTPMMNSASEATRIVQEFLAAIQNNQTGKDPAAYLNDRLKFQLSAGKTFYQLLNVKGPFPGFDLSQATLNANGSQAILLVTFKYSSPLMRQIMLLWKNNSWKIDDIAIVENGIVYPSTPEAVVESFLAAYQEAPSQMNRFLTKNRQKHLPSGGVIGYLHFNGILEGFAIQSGSVTTNPAKALVTVAVKIGGVETKRIFTLAQQDGKWAIDGIERAK
jgi:hypothetical protein